MKLSASLSNWLESKSSEYHTHLDSVAQYLVGRGLAKETAATFRLGYVASPEHDDADYAGRLAIPYLSADGKVLDLRFRAVDDRTPKYLSRHGAKVRIFNVGAFTAPTGTMHITEGEIDAMTLVQCGIPAVGIPGAKQWQHHWRLLFADYDVVKVITDGDKAGHEFGKKVSSEVEGTTIISLPDGEDVNSVYTKFGEDKLRELIGA